MDSCHEITAGHIRRGDLVAVGIIGEAADVGLCLAVSRVERFSCYLVVPVVNPSCHLAGGADLFGAVAVGIVEMARVIAQGIGLDDKFVRLVIGEAGLVVVGISGFYDVAGGVIGGRGSRTPRDGLDGAVVRVVNRLRNDRVAHRRGGLVAVGIVTIPSDAAGVERPDKAAGRVVPTGADHVRRDDRDLIAVEVIFKEGAVKSVVAVGDSFLRFLVRQIVGERGGVVARSRVLRDVAVAVVNIGDGQVAGVDRGGRLADAVIDDEGTVACAPSVVATA